MWEQETQLEFSRFIRMESRCCRCIQLHRPASSPYVSGLWCTTSIRLHHAGHSHSFPVPRSPESSSRQLLGTNTLQPVNRPEGGPIGGATTVSCPLYCSAGYPVQYPSIPHLQFAPPSSRQPHVGLAPRQAIEPGPGQIKLPDRRNSSGADRLLLGIEARRLLTRIRAPAPFSPSPSFPSSSLLDPLPACLLLTPAGTPA